mmetsp:Transcript_159830/g.298007  ORF Transcript_159830/g.298007 Transcript_159830/m.298007 type:complete len:254 (-) Transcript_159830:33-794(-)
MMKSTALLLTCLACSTGRRRVREYVVAEDSGNALAACAKLLMAFNAAPAGLQVHRRDVLRGLLAAATSPLILVPGAAIAKKIKEDEPVPTPQELSRLTLGLSRIDYLLENWDELLTECKGGATKNSKGPRTMDEACKATPMKVQKYIGMSSTLDPLFQADKLMLRAEPLIAEDKKDKYVAAVDKFISKQQMSTTTAYISSWSGYENPNGSNEAIDEALEEAKKEVLSTRKVLNKVIDFLELPPPKKYNPKDYM